MRALAPAIVLAIALLLPAASAQATPAAPVASASLADWALAQTTAGYGLLAKIDEGADAFALGRAALEARAATFGVALHEPAASTARAPGAAALDLLARHGVAADERALAALAELDATPEPTRGALAGVIEAFLRVDAIARAEFPASVDLAQNQFAPDALARAGVDVGALLGAHAQLLSAVEALDNAPRANAAAACGPPVVYLPPAVIIDLDECTDVYEHHVALLIDAGGNDFYRNNAGGGNAFRLVPAAALVDLAGNDHYIGGHSHGSNGGASDGTGFLLDRGGDDTYSGGDHGVNGGSFRGVGFLLDVYGTDAYVARDTGVNGGGSGGLGFLVDGAGIDRYVAVGLATNGAGSIGAGFLLDADGSDLYLSGGNAANGGAVGGAGLLVDGGGDDVYTAGDIGANGGTLSGVATLLDRNGNDKYTAGDSGANGGSNLGGYGYLRDFAGNDSYVAGGLGTNGASSVGYGALIDDAGDDRYEATSTWVNGGGLGGLLYDGAGHDVYVEDEAGIFYGGGVNKSVIPKWGGAQIDWPIRDARFDLWAHDPFTLENDDEAGPTLADERITDADPVKIPPCSLAACSTPLRHEGVTTPGHDGGAIHTIPGLPSIPVGTPGVGQVCPVIFCIGPIQPIKIIDTPPTDPIPVNGPPVESHRVLEAGELPAACAALASLCAETVLHPGGELRSPRVDPIHHGLGGTSGVSTGGAGYGIDGPDGTRNVGPIRILGPPVPITICDPTPCPVPNAGGVRVYGDATVYVEAGDTREERTVKI